MQRKSSFCQAHIWSTTETHTDRDGTTPCCYPDALPCFQVALLLCGRALCKTSPNRPWANPCCSGLAHGRKAMRHSPGPGNRRRAPGACAYVNSSCTSRATKRISATGLTAQAAAQTAQTGEGPAHHTGRIGCAMKPASLGNVHSLRSNVRCGVGARPTWSPTWPLLAEPVEL